MSTAFLIDWLSSLLLLHAHGSVYLIGIIVAIMIGLVSCKMIFDCFFRLIFILCVDLGVHVLSLRLGVSIISSICCAVDLLFSPCTSFSQKLAHYSTLSSLIFLPLIFLLDLSISQHYPTFPKYLS